MKSTIPLPVAASLRCCAAFLAAASLRPSVYAASAAAPAADERLCLVDGGRGLPIVLPEVTELDDFMSTTPEATRAAESRRFPRATAEELDRIVQRRVKWRQEEKARVGDDEKLAAQELAEYLGRMSGVAFAVTSSPALPPGRSIAIGSSFARAAGFGPELDRLAPDGLLIAVRNGRLHLAGRRARGTLYAVYSYLESQGVRWFMPGRDGERVPSVAAPEAAGTFTDNPSHAVRYWWCTYGNGAEYPRWTLRNKGNFVRALGDPPIAQHHALAAPLSAAGKLPDEFYALKDGKPCGYCPNMSNPKVWDLYAKYYSDFFLRDPTAEYASISAEDGLMLDERSESKMLDANEFDPYMGAMSATDRMWFFHTRYIDRVLKDLPGRRFGVLVYSNNLTPPRIVTVHPAMALVLAPLGISPLFSVLDPRSVDNRAYRGWLESWMGQAKAVGAETYYYDYEPTGFCWNKTMICPRWPIIGENYRYFHSLGLTGHATQGWDDWGSSAVDNWMMIRLYWKADVDWRDVMDDYCARRFLDAGPAMRRYYAAFERRMAEIPELCGNEAWGNHLVLTPEVRAAARVALAEAESAAVDPYAKRQVAIAREIQDSTDAFCDGIEYARETADYAAAARKLLPAFDIVEKSRARYSHAMNPRAGLAGDRVFEPGGWYKKYLAFDARIRKAKASLALPRFWKTALDTDNLATTRDRLQDPARPVDALDDWDITVVPDVKYGTQKQLSAVFMRTSFDVPAGSEWTSATLYFPSLIARALQIWVNGRPISFDHGSYSDTIYRGPATFWYDYNHQLEFPLGDMIRPGERNTIAMRIFKSFDHAGSYDRPFVLAE